MSPRSKVSRPATYAGIVIFVLAALVAVRYSQAIDTGASHRVAVRTYVFWAAVVAPVAYMVDLLGRTIANYRFVRLVVARVQANTRER